MMRIHLRQPRSATALVLISLAMAAAGCDPSYTTPPSANRTQRTPRLLPVDTASGGDHRADSEAAREADYSLFFVGNSHTWMHDMPTLVRQMIEHAHPGKKVTTRVVSVGFLEEAMANAKCVADIESGAWKHVILQAQKISVSGKFEYSRKEGIELAKRAKKSGAAAIYYGEWGLKGKPGDGARQTKVYEEMADQCDATVAPVARAWDLALEKDPSFPLHSSDGNHQSVTGAFLTACVLYGQITGESPLELAKFPYPQVDEKTRALLAKIADEALAEQKKKSQANEKPPATKLP